MELYCTFLSIPSYENPKVNNYICKVTKIIRIAPNGNVCKIIGEHLNGKSNSDVEIFNMNQIEAMYFPRYLPKFFPNLKNIFILNCGIQKISKLDFIGCEKIERIMLNGNNITTLESDLFEYAPNTREISFFYNKIEEIDTKMFEKLKNLEYFNLKINRKYDFRYAKNGGERDVKHMHQFVGLIEEKVNYEKAEFQRYFKTVKIVDANGKEI